jgi:hypothetical protein
LTHDSNLGIFTDRKTCFIENDAFAIIEGKAGFIETEDDRRGVGHAESIGKMRNNQLPIRSGTFGSKSTQNCRE